MRERDLTWFIEEEVDHSTQSDFPVLSIAGGEGGITALLGSLWVSTAKRFT